eukprot:TRINITY_DN1000_c0_g1_i1.p1 TRINITY_DN1000_c0_g1~~TRINITY_DN1000_c0_g1_i1.p1  ORF type:complete len:531 (-),score=145.57 TRINITY_DN1000_c0_g1_i1:156-1718(-)
MSCPHTYPAYTDGPVKCTWVPNTTEKSPHHHEPISPNGRPFKASNSILDFIGYTPMVKLNSVAKHLKCNVYAKCEYFNAGGSVKDRIGKRMVEEAERSGRLKPGDTLIEPTSGNTGIGLALAAAVKGYRMIITLPEKMSQEKVDVLKALGAEIIRTPTEAAWDSPESHISVARRLNAEIPNSHILDQYLNIANPLAHYDGTGAEILTQLDGKVDMVVVGAGTGGTLTGIARKIKEDAPNCKIIGVDPHGSILAVPSELNKIQGSYLVEGIGYDFIPTVCERKYVDEWYKTFDKESLLMARRLIREEGLLCGGSSGTAVVAALKAAESLGEGQNCVVILPDSVRNYMTKFLNNGWMEEKGFIDLDQLDELPGHHEWWEKKTIADLPLPTPCTITPGISCGDAVDILKQHGYDQLPVVATSGEIVGVVTEGSLLSHLVNKRVSGTDPVSKVVYKQFKEVTPDTSLRKLSRIFDRDHFVLVATNQKSFTSATQFTEKKIVTGLATRIDLINYIMASQKEHTPK